MRAKTKMFMLGVVSAAAVVLAPQPGLAADSRASATEEKTATAVVQQPDGRGPAVGGLVVVAGRGGGGSGPGGIVWCPPGYHLSPFEMPIYDEAGLFVVGYETVWFCIPDDLEPAG